ncbi:hypothetical protein RHS01_02965 [Rhizoctonia solani]|uniref:Uncharacterized protein n=1 Tax=Rhizoctonia solani TaxID=456999 RepID=A0A8H7M7A4_9AGAM|nr:hypothetical protein RHS01_02965 [Rhizoctonia solani]
MYVYISLQQRSIALRQETATDTTGGTTPAPPPTTQSQTVEETTTPRASDTPSRTTPVPSSTNEVTPTSPQTTPTTPTTPTTTNEPTTTQQTSASTPPTTSPTQPTTSRIETSETQITTTQLTSTSPTSQSTTPLASVTTTQSEITSALPSTTSIPTLPTTSSTLDVSLSTVSTVSTTSGPSSAVSDTQTSSHESISSPPTDTGTSRTSTPVITTSGSDSNTIPTTASAPATTTTQTQTQTPTPTPTPTPTQTPTPSPTPTQTPTPTTPTTTISTTPVQESTTINSASSSTLTSVTVTTTATVDGRLTTASYFTTVVPTLASLPEGTSGLSARSSKIVGGVVGGTLALLGILLVLFYISRRRRKAAAVRDAPRLQAPRQMLDADDFDLAEPAPAPYAYGMVGARANPNPSGSIFHEGLPGTSTQHTHSYSRSMVSENDPLLAHHMRGGSADIDSVATSSPRDPHIFVPLDQHCPTISTTRRDQGVGARSTRGPDQHVYPPSAYRGPVNSSEPLPSSSPVIVHQDAGHFDIPDIQGPLPMVTRPVKLFDLNNRVRNMAHGLHIIRNIETKYGAIESFLFPRESGTNEYHPTFFFRFREPKAIRQLAKPYTHLDIPVLELEDKPNHEIGMNDVGYLVSPNSSGGCDLKQLNKPSTLKSRYAIRIAVSGLDEYPQPFFSHKTINVHERVRIERELAGWKGAYETLESASSSSQPQAHLKAQSIEELLQENFNVPQNTLVLPQTNIRKNRCWREIAYPGNSSNPRNQRSTNYSEYIHEGTLGDSPIKGAVADDTPATGSSVQSSARVSAKRERQLEQMRRAAASQVRLIAEKRRIDEEAAKRSKAASEAGTDDHLPASNQGGSLWDRFLGR